jgi:hypothetical protein
MKQVQQKADLVNSCRIRRQLNKIATAVGNRGITYVNKRSTKGMYYRWFYYL